MSCVATGRLPVPPSVPRFLLLPPALPGARPALHFDTHNCTAQEFPATPRGTQRRRYGPGGRTDTLTYKRLEKGNRNPNRLQATTGHDRRYREQRHRWSLTGPPPVRHPRLSSAQRLVHGSALCVPGRVGAGKPLIWQTAYLVMLANDAQTPGPPAGQTHFSTSAALQHITRCTPFTLSQCTLFCCRDADCLWWGSSFHPFTDTVTELQSPLRVLPQLPSLRLRTWVRKPWPVRWSTGSSHLPGAPALGMGQ
jgi:hypothetical protein